MKREIKLSLILILLIVITLSTVYLFMNNLQKYAIILSAIDIIVFICLITTAINTSSEDRIYKSTLRKLLKNYDSVLVQSYNFPKLAGKNIIKIANFDDLIDAQQEIRKPIYYMIEGEDSCSFVLLDNNEACIYILKMNENVVSPLELIMAEYEKHQTIDESLLADIERTTIIKLGNMKSFKVSPIKKKNKQNVSTNEKIVEVAEKNDNAVVNDENNKITIETKDAVKKDSDVKDENKKNKESVDVKKNAKTKEQEEIEML